MEQVLVRSERNVVLRHVVVVALGAALVTLAAQVAVPLPGTPVPMTLQPLAVLLVGGLLGARLGAMSMVRFMLLVARSLSKRNCCSSLSFGLRASGSCFGSCARANDVAMTDRLVASEMARLRTNLRENRGTSNSKTN